GRVDQHAVEGALLTLQPFGVVGTDRPALDIVRAGAAQPLRRAVEAALIDVHRHHAALVVHAGGDRQGLAAGAGAVIRDLHAGPAVDQRRHDLRALVLHFHQAVLESVARHDGEPALQPEAAGRIGHRLGLDAFTVQRRARLLHFGLQAIDAQVDRWRIFQRGDLATPGLAI